MLHIFVAHHHYGLRNDLVFYNFINMFLAFDANPRRGGHSVHPCGMGVHSAERTCGGRV
jgi:hypothetical protein